MEKTKKYIIFDMDGTLSDTAIATTDALNEASFEFGLPLVTQNDVSSVMGYADPEFFYRLYTEHPHDLLNDVRYRVNYLEDKRIEEIGEKILFPGVSELLNDLFKKGCMLYVASTGSTEHVDVTLRAGKIKHLFDGIFCNKPDKVDMVGKIINGQDKNNFVMVGDMVKDSEAARGNNILVLGAAFGYLKESNHHLFDAILQKPEDLYGYL